MVAQCAIDVVGVNVICSMPIIKKTTKRPWQPERKQQEGRQHSNSKFYQSSRWRRVRASYIMRNPLCVECQRKGLVVPARVVDHITPINKGGAPYLEENLQSLCDRCHNSKSGKEAHQK